MSMSELDDPCSQLERYALRASRDEFVSNTFLLDLTGSKPDAVFAPLDYAADRVFRTSGRPLQ